MEEQNNSIESIVVLSDSLVTDNQSYRIGNNFINQNELTSSQMTIRNDLNDTGSSSFMTTNQDPELLRMEREILNLKALLNAYKNENSELRFQLQKQAKRDVFCDVDSAFLMEKIENNLIEANRIFDNESKLKDSMQYLIKNFWSSIAFTYADRKLLALTRTRDQLLFKLENACQKSDKDLKFNEIVKQMECLQENNLKLKAKLAEQNKLLDSFLDLYEKSRNVPQEPIEENSEEKTLTNEAIPEFYLYNAHGYIAIDQDLSLNKELQAKPVDGLFNTDQTKLLKCPKCLTTVDTDSISYEMYQAHIENCDGESNYVCMFCLCWFDKSRQHEYLNHIDVHLGQLGSELNN